MTVDISLLAPFLPLLFAYRTRFILPLLLLLQYHDTLVDWRWLLFYFNTYHLWLYSPSLLIVFVIPSLSLSGYPPF